MRPLTANNMPRPKVLIEQWLPIDQIGAECMRERGASSALPPLYFLHVWWARRPLTVSRAAILASLLPAYPNGDPDVRPWSEKFLKRFPTFDAYKKWFLGLIGILGDPAASRKIIDWAKTQGIKLTPNILSRLPTEWTQNLPADMGVSIPYGYSRAFTYNPSEEQLATLYDMLESTWGTREITFCDPMAGGGSIAFEALRYGLSVRANELNPVASVILKATLDYPARFGSSLADVIRKYGSRINDQVRERLQTYFPPFGDLESVFAYVWARTVNCPTTGRLIPLVPNWYITTEGTPVAMRMSPAGDSVRFDTVRGREECRKCNAHLGTIKQGTGLNPWTNEALDGEYIKQEAQAGRMREILYAVVTKGASGVAVYSPRDSDIAAVADAERSLQRLLTEYEARGLVPSEDITEVSNYDRGHRLYGIRRWRDFYAPRQLLSLLTYLDALRMIVPQLHEDLGEERAIATQTYLAFVLDKAAMFNSYYSRWAPNRTKMNSAFDRHDFSIKWSFGEFDAANSLFPWSLDQILDAYGGIASLGSHSNATLFARNGKFAQISQTTATNLRDITSGSIATVCTDPPYYDNVMYAECSDYFYVWQKRSIGDAYPNYFASVLTNKDDEAVANLARFASFGAKKKKLAAEDYERKMRSTFAEIGRIVDEGSVTIVMFTHKSVDAWDTLATSIIGAGLSIRSSWPVQTEYAASLHQAKKNAAASTILLACRKRERRMEPVWWDDLKPRVRQMARRTAAEFEKQGIRGVDLYISTFGPVLSIISENWPVLTSETDPKTGDPLPLKPGEALDLAREEVINLRKQGLLLGRSVEFDPITDWYLMAWDAFRAQEFPADEARKLALALGLDLERDIIKEKRLVSKKSGTVVLAKPADRRKKNMVDPEADAFPQLIDALHTAMLVYDEEGSKACQVFVDSQGLSVAV